ncbi:hypothetical protein P280DRAFT_52705 [Massarina eburnea CBS 473.64]|uniref:Uncharacterized protein n=1 Tax=Massarina eburnea CBS 473.64 TaxID=1395130 RepID=A0A6A6RG79_9PLEO|nr:hypothetical protein P280DRAFT_52705 [Massarina eburnea CBS 473.64]
MKRYDAIDKSLPGSGLAPRPKRPRSVKVAMITAVTLLVVWSALKGLAPDLVESVLGGLMGEKEDYVAQYKSFDFFAVSPPLTFTRRASNGRRYGGLIMLYASLMNRIGLALQLLLPDVEKMRTLLIEQIIFLSRLPVLKQT